MLKLLKKVNMDQISLKSILKNSSRFSLKQIINGNYIIGKYKLL